MTAWSRFGRAVALSGAYLALFVGLTWPLIRHATTAVVTNRGDALFDMLLFWHARQGDLLAPHTATLFFPWGTSLGADIGYWLVPYMSVPLQAIMPLPLVYNVLAALFFVATGAATYALARETGAARAGSFLAGALVLLSPAYLSELAHGTPENLGLQWLVGLLWCGLRLGRGEASRSGSWRIRLLAAGAGLCFALCWLQSWYLGAFAVLVLPLLPLQRMAPAAVVVVLVLAGPLVMTLRGGVVAAVPGGYSRSIVDDLVARRVRLPGDDAGELPPGEPLGSDTSTLLPSVADPYGLRLQQAQPPGESASHREGTPQTAGTPTGPADPAGLRLAQASAEGKIGELYRDDLPQLATGTLLASSADPYTLFVRPRLRTLRYTWPGLLLLGLAALGMLARPTVVRPWLGLALACGFLALGPYLMWRGYIVMRLPSELVYHALPALASLRPVRWLLPGSLALGLMAAHGLVPLRRPVWGTAAAAAALLALQWIGTSTLQGNGSLMPLAEARPPAWYATIAGQAGGALLEVPLTSTTLASYQTMFCQTVHHRPLLNYDLSPPQRLLRLAEQARAHPVLAALLGNDHPVPYADAAWLGLAGFSAVVLHARVEDSAGGTSTSPPFLFSDGLFDTLRALFGASHDEGDGLLVFDVEHLGEAGARAAPESVPDTGTRLALAVGPGLSAAGGQVRVAVLPRAPWAEVRAWVQGCGARLAVRQGQRLLVAATVQVSGWQWLRLPLPPETGAENGARSGCEVVLEAPGAARLTGLSAWQPAAPPREK